MFQPFLNAVWIFEGYNFALREAAVLTERKYSKTSWATTFKPSFKYI